MKKKLLIIIGILIFIAGIIGGYFGYHYYYPKPILEKEIEEEPAQKPPVEEPPVEEPPVEEPPVEEPPVEPPQPGVSGILEEKYEKEGKLTLIGVEERIDRELFVLSFELPSGAYIFAPFDGSVHYYSYKGSSIKVEGKDGLTLWVYSPEYDAWENKKRDGAEIKKGEVVAVIKNKVKIEIYFDSERELVDILVLKKFFPFPHN